MLRSERWYARYLTCGRLISCSPDHPFRLLWEKASRENEPNVSQQVVLTHLVCLSVIPAKAGIQAFAVLFWIPAFAGMTPDGALPEKSRDGDGPK